MSWCDRMRKLGQRRRGMRALWGGMVAFVCCAHQVVRADVCVDFDGGNSPGVKGAVEVAGPSGIPVQHWDECSNHELLEQVCVTDPQKIEVGARSIVMGEQRTVKVLCPGGCRDGACVGLPSGCVDTDPKDDPYIRGVTRQYSSNASRTVTDSREDECGVGGFGVKEFGCMDGRVTQLALKECRSGCVDGRCVDPAKASEGCFVALKVEERSSNDTRSSLFSVLGYRSVVGAYFDRVAPEESVSLNGMRIETYSKQKKLLQRYSINSSVYFIAEDPGKASASAVIKKRMRELFIPYDSLAVEAKIVSPHQSIAIPFNRSRLLCARECLLPGESSSVGEGSRVCCPGGVPSYFNDTSYVCKRCDSKNEKGCSSEKHSYFNVN